MVMRLLAPHAERLLTYAAKNQTKINHILGAIGCSQVEQNFVKQRRNVLPHWE